MHKEMHPDTHRDLTQRLIDEFKFKDKSRSTLRQGRCPSCGEKELWAYASAPWVLMCGRTTNCNHQIHVRDHYPDLFENWKNALSPPPPIPTPPQMLIYPKGVAFHCPSSKAYTAKNIIRMQSSVSAHPPSALRSMTTRTISVGGNASLMTKAYCKRPHSNTSGAQQVTHGYHPIKT